MAGHVPERAQKNALSGRPERAKLLQLMLRSMSCGKSRDFRYFSLVKITVPDEANMPPTPWATLILAPGTWAGATPRI